LTVQFLQRALSGRKQTCPGVSNIASAALTSGRAQLSALTLSPVRLQHHKYSADRCGLKPALHQ